MALTPALRKRITEDWKLCFSSLEVYRLMHLLRRVGPLLMGISLEPDSSNLSYRPTFHVHSLARSSDFIRLTLSQPLRTERTLAPETIDVQWHDQHFKDAAQRLGRQAILPLEGDLRLDEVLDAYRNYSEGGRHQPNLYEDMALICAWTSETERARSVLNWASGRIREWPSDFAAKIGDIDKWRDNVLRQISDPKSIHHTVDKEIEKHGLQNLPVSKLLI